MQDGSSYEVCLSGNFLYVGAANTLKVYSLNGSNHTPDVNTFSYRFRSNIDQILVHDGALYVCANHAGLWKFDISQDPSQPVYLTDFAPANIHESIYDVAFYGDSLIVAAKNKLLLLLDSANAIQYLATIKTSSGDGRIHGVDIKGNLLAYTLGLSSNANEEGVYLFDLASFQQLDFFHQAQADAWEVYFGQSNSLLHVMGGNFPLTVNGLYYTLDYSNPGAMQLAYLDTIRGYANSQAMPMNAEIIHDTVYIATQGAVKIGYQFPTPLTGQVYVYDATNSANVRRIEDLYAGLYHFDIAIDSLSRTMYVASEWYGVLTVDIQDLGNEISRGKTLTGGWCHGSAFAGNRLVEANEGYGVRMFDMTVRQSPQLIHEDTAVGFCRAISIAPTADHVYAWYLTGKRLRVYDGADLSLQADTTVDPTELLVDDFQKSRLHGNYIAVIEIPTFPLFPKVPKLIVANVSNPQSPYIAHIRRKSGLEDLVFHPSGKLIALANDSILVFDPATMQLISSVTPPLGGLQPYKAMTFSRDTLYVFYQGIGEGIARYFVDPGSFALTLKSATPHAMDSDNRIFMATNDTVLFIGSTLDQLKALTILPPHTAVASYDHGADHMFDNLWGVHDLYYADGLLVLNEYMGQSSLFGAPSAVGLEEDAAMVSVILHPNPVRDVFRMETGIALPVTVWIRDLQGRILKTIGSYISNEPISTVEWQPGIYFVTLEKDHRLRTAKLVKL